MKYGAIPGNVFERLALALGRVPLPLVDSVYGPIKAPALLAGRRLGVFDAMRAGWHRTEPVAVQLGLDAATLDLLLRVLVFAGYLEQDGDRYALSRLGRRSFVRGGGLEMTGLVQWNRWMWDMIGRMEDV